MNPFDWESGDPFTDPEVVMPPRSVLFRLSPAGVGTPQQESLVSLLVRTAYAHSVNPRHLVDKVLGQVDQTITRLTYASFFAKLAGTINGLGKYAEKFMSVMETLTIRDDLRSLTMLPWKEFFPHNGQGLLARHPRWCPVCLVEQRQRGEESFHPLAWSLETVHVCTYHQRGLMDHCPHCGKCQPFIPKYPDLAACDYCHRPLVNESVLSEASDKNRPTIMELWVAEAVGQMIASQGVKGFHPSVEQFQSVLLDQVAATTEGNRAAFCRAIGLQPRALNNWISKGERPSMTQFLAFCYGMRVMPKEIFGAETKVKPALFKATPLKRRVPGPRLTRSQRNELGKLLRLYLQAQECLPVTRIAEIIGIAPRSLRYWFPELCGCITARYRNEETRRIADRRAEQCKVVVEVVRQLREIGNYPSRRRVNASLRDAHMSLAQPYLLAAYLAAMTEENPPKMAWRNK